MAIVEIRNLVKRREQSGSAFELRVPELVFEAGRFYGIAGPSGSGKSTLLDVLALVWRPISADKFRIASLNGSEAWNVSDLWGTGDESVLADLRKGMFGYVLQSGGLIGFLSVRQNLTIPYQLLGQRPDPQRIQALAERFGIERELDKKPRHLSTGQRQRAAILRALMLRPALILADEPTAALDQVRSAQIAAEFRALALEGGSTIVMVSHDWQLLSSVADAMVVLSGDVDASGTAVSTTNWDGVWSGFKAY
jgi:putative ABC transport system ATP-binding protein